VIISNEILLVAGIFALYLFDSSSLLYSNELILSESKRSFSATTGSSLQIGGRFLYVPNILKPHHAHFKGSWSWRDHGAAREFIPELLHFVDALSLPKAGCALLAGLMFLALPYLLLTSGKPLLLLFTLCSIYLTIAVMVHSAYRHRKALELSRRQIALIGTEAFLCPPFAINFVRKICEKRGLKQDALALSQRLLSRNRMLSTLAAVQERLATSIAFTDESSKTHEEMTDFAKRLKEHHP